MNQILERISRLKLIPVVKIEKEDDAVTLGNALIKGGLPLAEITFRTDAAESSKVNLSKHLPEMLIGAGTVTTIEHVKKAINSGAKFMVAPGFNPKVVDYCLENNILIVPDINSPSQIEQGLEHGLEVLKFFPAEASGGLKLLKAMAEPYGGVNFVPTGGIDASNLRDYLAFKRVAACGGSWFVKANLISEGRFDEIKRLTHEAMNLIEL
jgi:2-dehydro-3-deoxyphosphogluconate aldolase/(4S)-4-hydroxy-2-oxoglutarate aldolase